MTNNEKQQILQLRRNGFGYKKIAAELGISINTVKSFCRRNEVATAVCQTCGKPLSGKKQTKFCSVTCKNKWWNSHPKKNALIISNCLYCQKSFKSQPSKHRRFCCKSCSTSYQHQQEAIHD